MLRILAYLHGNLSIFLSFNLNLSHAHARTSVCMCVRLCVLSDKDGERGICIDLYQINKLTKIIISIHEIDIKYCENILQIIQYVKNYTILNFFFWSKTYIKYLKYFPI